MLAHVVVATYSIVGADTAARQVGGAVTSCVPFSVSVVYGSVPGIGAVHAQARLSSGFRDQAVQMLEAGVAPADIIAAVTSADAMAEERQYGIVDLMARTAGFTGSQTMPYAEDRQGADGAFVYSAQGNILTGPAVLDQAEGAFLGGGGCDLADRLMLALEAGGQNGEGDSRCTPMGIPSNAAFIEVDLEGMPAGSYLRLDVQTGSENPLVELRAQYDAWRQTHPCAAAGEPDAGVGGDEDGGVGGEGDGDGGGCGCRVGGGRGSGVGVGILSLIGIVVRARGRGGRRG
jgi:uncharacterized Ntn-hydrolase superfamily protein